MAKDPGSAPTGAVVVGCGFGGVATVRALRKRDRRLPITVVAPRPRLTYYASLIWVPTGLRQGPELERDLSDWFARHDVRFVAAEATGLSADGRVLATTAGEMGNDALVIASGPRFLRTLPGIEHAHSPCAGVAAAQYIRDRVANPATRRIAVGFASNPKEPAAVRGGPMFELLFGLETWLRRQRRRAQVELTFFNAAAEPGARLGGPAVQGLLAEMQARGIRTHLGHKPLAFSAEGVRTEGGEIPADLILFMSGLTGSAWFEGSPLPLSAGGFVQADMSCRVPGLARVYAVGDAASYAEAPDWMPKQGHQADLQGRAAAATLLADLAGRPEAAERFAPDLMCIVDMLDKGVMIHRTPAALRIRQGRHWHWAKRAFEHVYLRGLS